MSFLIFRQTQTSNHNKGHRQQALSQKQTVQDNGFLLINAYYPESFTKAQTRGFGLRKISRTFATKITPSKRKSYDMQDSDSYASRVHIVCGGKAGSALRQHYAGTRHNNQRSDCQPVDARPTAWSLHFSKQRQDHNHTMGRQILHHGHGIRHGKHNEKRIPHTPSAARRVH